MGDLHNAAEVEVGDEYGNGSDEDDKKAAASDENASTHTKIPAALQGLTATRADGLGGVGFIVTPEACLVFYFRKSRIHREKIVEFVAKLNAKKQKDGSEIRKRLSPLRN
jgi:hypothetical protein